MTGVRPAVLRRWPLLAAIALATAMPLPAFADVSHLAVRFREAARDVASPADATRLQAVTQAARTGIGEVTVTADGAYRIGLSPPLSDAGARAALARLRQDPDVLYADPAPPVPVGAGRVPAKDAARRLDRIVVRFRDPQVAADAAQDLPLPAQRVAELAARAGRPLASQRAVPWAGAHVVVTLARLPRDEIEAMARAIAAHPDVAWAHPDYPMRPSLAPNDPLYPNQWHYRGTVNAPPNGTPEPGGANLEGAWNRTTGWSGIRIAVVDTGALTAHPDLAGRLLGGYDFVLDWVYANDNDPAPTGCAPGDLSPACISRDANPVDPGDWISPEDDFGLTFGGYLQGCGISASSWHGTHVAGTVGAATSNASGVAGVNWTGPIVPIRALGKCGGYISDIADGLVWAAGGSVAGVPANPYPARVANLSLGGGGNCSTTPLMQSAINTALGLGTAVIVAAGNEGDDASNYSPASCNGVVTVAAVGRQGQRASYSNVGAVVEIAAPGGSDGHFVLSTLNSGTTTPVANGMNFAGYQGTSMAAPHVAGIVSLMLSLKPSLTPAEVTSVLQATARPFPTGTLRDCSPSLCGAGIVDATAALNAVATAGGPGGTALVASSAALASSANPATVGVAVTLTATVTGTAPTGTVTFTDGLVPLAGCTDVNLAGAGNVRTAQCVTSALVPGTHPLRAAYSGNAAHAPSDSALLQQVVNPAAPQASATSLASSRNPSAQGASVTFTATITGVAPSGAIDFRANGVTIAGCGAVPAAGIGDVRTAQCATSSLPPGTIAIEARYAGNASNLPSTGALAQGVIAAGACVNFNDLPATSPFCDEVQWIFNRGITQGCTSTAYCPDAPVIRDTMAAFINRTGSALTPIDLPRVVDQIVLQSLGPAGMPVCADNQQHAFTVTGAPRQARVQAFANVFNATGNAVVTAQLVYSTNGGSTWAPVPNTALGQSLYAGRVPADDRTLNLQGEVDLAVGTTYTFGVHVAATPVTGLEVYCSALTRIFNRNGSSAPF